MAPLTETSTPNISPTWMLVLEGEKLIVAASVFVAKIEHVVRAISAGIVNLFTESSLSNGC